MPVAPKSNRDHRRLEEILQYRGVQPVDLQWMFWRLNFPEKMDCLLLIVRGLSAALHHLSSIGENLDVFGMESWPSICDAIEASAEDLKESFDGLAEVEKSRGVVNNPAVGLFASRNPLCAALCCSIENTRFEREFIAAKANLVVAQAMVHEAYSIPNDYLNYAGEKPLKIGGNSISGASAFIRHISQTPDDAAIFAYINISACPHTLATPGKYWLKFRINEPKYSKAFREYLFRAHHHQRWADKAGPGNKGGSPWGRDVAKFDDIGVVIENLGHFGRLEVDATPHDEDGHPLTALRLKELDADPDDLNSENPIGLTDGEAARIDPRKPTACRNGERQTQALERENTMTGNDYKACTPYEAEIFAKHCKMVLTEIRRADDDRHFAARALLVDLATGCGLAAACQIVATDRPDAAFGKLAITKINECHYFVLPAYEPTYQSELLNPKAECRKRVGYVLLQDVTGIAGLLPGKTVRKHGYKGQSLIRRSPEDILSAVESILAEVNSQHELAITSREISLFLVSRIADLGHPAWVAQICGLLRKAVRPRLHYSTPRLIDINGLYAQGMAELGRSLEAPFPDPAGFSREHLNFHVGARYCPTAAAVRDAIRRLQGDLEKLPLRTPIDHVNYHNLYVTYVILTICLCVAHRPVNRIDLPLMLGGSDNKFLVAADKGLLGDSSNRALPAIDLLIQQTEDMDRHVLAVATMTGMFPDASVLNRQTKIFYIREDYKPSKNVVADYTKAIRPYLDIPPNSMRRFLATELLERGCPRENVDSLLGHGGIGEEFGNRFSRDVRRRTLKSIRFHLMELLRDVGLHVVRSRLIARQ